MREEHFPAEASCLSLWERWHSEAVTERVFPRTSHLSIDHPVGAAISRPALLTANTQIDDPLFCGARTPVRAISQGFLLLSIAPPPKAPSLRELAAPPALTEGVPPRYDPRKTPSVTASPRHLPQRGRLFSCLAVCHCILSSLSFLKLHPLPKQHIVFKGNRKATRIL